MSAVVVDYHGVPTRQQGPLDLPHYHPQLHLHCGRGGSVCRLDGSILAVLAADVDGVVAAAGVSTVVVDGAD